jgi:hypothetical protein
MSDATHDRPTPVERVTLCSYCLAHNVGQVVYGDVCHACGLPLEVSLPDATFEELESPPHIGAMALTAAWLGYGLVGIGFAVGFANILADAFSQPGSIFGCSDVFFVLLMLVLSGGVVGFCCRGLLRATRAFAAGRRARPRGFSVVTRAPVENSEMPNSIERH